MVVLGGSRGGRVEIAIFFYSPPADSFSGAEGFPASLMQVGRLAPDPLAVAIRWHAAAVKVKVGEAMGGPDRSLPVTEQAKMRSETNSQMDGARSQTEDSWKLAEVDLGAARRGTE